MGFFSQKKNIGNHDYSKSVSFCVFIVVVVVLFFVFCFFFGGGGGGGVAVCWGWGGWNVALHVKPCPPTS